MATKFMNELEIVAQPSLALSTLISLDMDNLHLAGTGATGEPDSTMRSENTHAHALHNNFVC